MVTDIDGYFSLDKVQAPLHLSDTLQFYYVGYETKELTLQQLMSKPADKLYLVRMDAVVMGAIVSYEKTPFSFLRRTFYRVKHLLGIY